MEFVYVVTNGKEIFFVCNTKTTATNFVNYLLTAKWGINPDTEPLDFSDFKQYGWADKIWWEKKVLHD